jgi:peptidoglycan LD-endopeptidase LytH
MNALVKQYYLYVLVAVIVLAGCSKSTFRGRSTPHNEYREALVKAGLQNTQLGGMWISAGENSLQRPLKINLPYKETGYFPADKPSASAYVFSLRRGDKVKISLTTNPASGIKIFAELWEPGRITIRDAPLSLMDTLRKNLQFSADKDADHILRIQPELLKGIEYNLTIITEPSFAFPVQQSGKPRIISLWGVGRDNGTRTHEGIDISATRRTPALAVANGYVTRVAENNLGGKVVFMRPDDQPYSVYYAHLDSQIVKQGQSVRAGDVIGLVGNSGNAKTTIPHLHFGIYTNNGAIDPIAFVEKDRPQPREVSGTGNHFNKWLRLKNDAMLYPSASGTNSNLKLKTGEAVYIQSASANFYKIILPTGQEGYIAYDQVTDAPLRKQKINVAKKLLDSPFVNAPSITIVPGNTEVEVKALYDNFIMVRYNNTEGWLVTEQ